MPAPRTVAAFLDALDLERRDLVETLRRTISAGRPVLREHMKWNSPTYSAGEDDLMTINVHNKQGQVQLVLHRGTGRKEDRHLPPILTDDEGLVRWVSDVRGLIAFPDRTTIDRSGAALNRVLDRWIELAARDRLGDA